MSFILLLTLTVLACFGYHAKRRNLRQLQVHQQMIHHQNRIQQKLLDEKDKLLADKDLLMREIHHRMKNNLSIIVSLLESQSKYLNHPPALAALRDTQNRVHAVFLLHQNLYGTSAGTKVDASRYVQDVIGHLKETFDMDNHNIVITHRIDRFYLDADQVLPLGVIINETITNAMKYAFPTGRKGHIRLTLNREVSGYIRLQVRDNGVGLPDKHHFDGDHSLGFSLISGLVLQLHGIWTIRNDKGVVVTIQFPEHRSASETSPEDSIW